MATYRYGNNYRLAIGLETSLGSGYTNGTAIRFDELVELPDTIEFGSDIQRIETGAKTQTGLSTYCENKPGYYTYTATMTGVLSNEHEILLKAATPDTATPYCVDALPTLKSYVILRIWSDAASTPYVADKATGCQLASFKIMGSSGDMVRYEAVFNVIAYDREVSQAITGTDPGVICTAGFNFGNMLAATELSFGDTEHLKSFELAINYELADDATSFQNSLARLETIPLKANCTLSYVTNYDVTNTSFDTKAEDLLHGATAINEVIALTLTTSAPATVNWTITTNGQLVSYTLADPGNALFENSVTERLCYYATPAYPVTIVIS